MTERYTALSGFTPENESDIMLRLRVLAGEIYHQRVYAEFIRRQLFPGTATGEYLDRHAEQRGLSRKAGTKAAGEALFTAAEEEHDDILIPAGTMICTTGDLQCFETDADVTITAEESDASVAVTAVKAGSAGNVLADTIGIIMTPVIGVGGVTNPNPFIGGSDDESDEELRERVVNSYREISNGTNAAYYRNTALAVDGVYSASAVGGARGAGTLDVYVCGQGTPVDASVLTRLQAVFDEARELNVDVLVRNPTAVSVNLYIALAAEDGYSLTALSEEVVNRVRAYIQSLGIGEDVLLSRIGEVIHHIEGVADYKFHEGYGANCAIADSEYAVPGTILTGSIT